MMERRFIHAGARVGRRAIARESDELPDASVALAVNRKRDSAQGPPASVPA
jgi:hypothetical protein